LHGFSSPVAGSGKSHLVDTVSKIATGREASVIAQGKDEPETEKRLGAILRYGDPLIALDNCEQPIGGDFLCQLLTQFVVRVRILGLSEAPELPTNTMVFATGNNLRVIGDLSRRALICSLDPEVERPELRIFRSNPVEKVRADRGRYVHAALTIVRAHRQSGAPRPTPLGSFEGWSDTIRGALIWLGMADSVDTMEKVRTSDPRLDEIVAVLAHWETVHGLQTQVSANRLIHFANKQDPKELGHEYVHEEFREDRKGAWHHCATDNAQSRRRADRMKGHVARVNSSMGDGVFVGSPRDMPGRIAAG
jgi:hypothetical protein